jgi:hypothetical protein
MTHAQGTQSLAQDSPCDVDRAMATFPASAIPYRKFVASPAAPVEVEQAENHVVATMQSLEVEHAVAFPLLVAALGEAVQSPGAQCPAPREAPVDKPHAPAPAPKKAEAMMTEVRAPERPLAQPPEMVIASEQSGTRPLSTAPTSLDLPRRHALATRTLKRHMPTALITANHTTSLAAMFRRLRAANPSSKELAEARSSLQDMLSRL